MSDVYAIKASTLTAIGDAVRNKTGKLTYELEEPAISAWNRNGPDQTNLLQDIPKGDNFFTVEIPNAVSIRASIYCKANYNLYYWIAPGIHTTRPDNATIFGDSVHKTYEYSFDTNAITIGVYSTYGGNDGGCGFYAQCYGSVVDTLTPLQMAEEINALAPSPTVEELTITGKCNYRFFQNSWNWFIEKYGEAITTKNITNANFMFMSSANLSNIPFDLNFNPDTECSVSSCFGYCEQLTTLPKLLNLRPSEASTMFRQCKLLKEIPEDFCDTWDWSYLDGLTGTYSGNCSAMFQDCFNLRKFPMALFEHGNPVISASNASWKSAFSSCYRLEEVIGMPNPHYNATYTGTGYSSPFNDMFKNCYRLTRFTFAEMDPPKWSNQTIDLSQYIGWTINVLYGSTYGGTAEEKNYMVFDDATYQALKDHPDWWAQKVEYSRYNHDSAVETINSLPDTSTTGSANVIKFKGASGEKTDGGAINTLTDEEIAVATAKGWTVSLV